MNKIEQLRISGQLPSPKGVALAIMEISRRDDASLDEVSRVVQSDPALSARLLRLTNSALAGNRRPVVSIQEAVLRLGMASVRQLAMGFSQIDQYPQGLCTAFDYPRFWSHSLFMAVASEELGRVVRIGGPEELFTCGLLAQIGRLALASVYPAEYTRLLEGQYASVTLRELERERLGVDHGEFTAAILAECGIPPSLAEPVHCHEAPEKSGFAQGSRPDQLTYLFFQARRMADLGLSPEAERQGGISELMLLGGKIGLNAQNLGEVFDRVVRHWRDWAELLAVPASRLPSFAAMESAPVHRLKPESWASCKRVLLVEDEPTSRILSEAMLREIFGCTVYTAENGQEALALALEVVPQIVVTDWLMPVMDGLELCRALRSTDWGQSMYVILLTGVETEQQIVEAFEAGTDDYLVKPVTLRGLNARMRAALHYVNLLENWENDRAQLKQFAAELAISNRRLETAAMTDVLTGLPNRRAGMDALNRDWSASRRSGQPVAALMIDIDLFKTVNDRHGHAVGDQVLQEVARALQCAARKHESISRIGGEEFLAVCHDTDARAALLAAERLRSVVKALKIVAAGVAIPVSVSIGIAIRETGMETADKLMRAADQALYAAKQAGRNRICLFAQGQTHCAGKP